MEHGRLVRLFLLFYHQKEFFPRFSLHADDTPTLPGTLQISCAHQWGTETLLAFPVETWYLDGNNFTL